MPCIRKTAPTFFVRYLSPLKPKVFAVKIEFWDGFFENLSFKITMSWLAGIGSPEVYLFIDLLKNLSIMLLGFFFSSPELCSG